MIIPFFCTCVFMFEVIEPDVFFLFVGIFFSHFKTVVPCWSAGFLGKRKKSSVCACVTFSIQHLSFSFGSS